MRAELLKSTVRIRCELEQGGRTITEHGTAFGMDLSQYGFSSRRCLLTAAHNVLDDSKKPYGTLKIEIADATRTYWSHCRVVAWDTDLDLCIVEADDDMPALLRLADSDVPIGGRLILAGSPRGVPVELFAGTLEQKFERGMVCSRARVPFDHGDSGGPMIDATNGRVVGVAVAGIPKGGDLAHDIGLFVPTVGIETFLDAHRRGRPVPSPLRGSPVITETVAHSPEPAPSAMAVTPKKPVAVPAPASGAPVEERKGQLSAAERILDEFK
jgi:hypothetical protein